MQFILIALKYIITRSSNIINMIIVQSTLVGALAKGLGNLNRKDRYWDRLLNKIVKNPVIFMGLLVVPGLIHHILFKYLYRIWPILYFCSGMFFALALELYLVLLLLHINEEEYKNYTEYDHINRSEAIETKLNILKSQAIKKDKLQKAYFCQRCNRIMEGQDSEYGECKWSEIEKYEINSETQEYLHSVRYPDPRKDSKFYKHSQSLLEIPEFLQKSKIKKQQFLQVKASYIKEQKLKKAQRMKSSNFLPAKNNKVRQVSESKEIKKSKSMSTGKIQNLQQPSREINLTEKRQKEQDTSNHNTPKQSRGQEEGTQQSVLRDNPKTVSFEADKGVADVEEKSFDIIDSHQVLMDIDSVSQRSHRLKEKDATRDVHIQIIDVDKESNKTVDSPNRKSKTKKRSDEKRKLQMRRIQMTKQVNDGQKNKDSTPDQLGEKNDMLLNHYRIRRMNPSSDFGNNSQTDLQNLTVSQRRRANNLERSQTSPGGLVQIHNFQANDNQIKKAEGGRGHHGLRPVDIEHNFDTIQEFIMNKVQISDEKLLEFIKKSKMEEADKFNTMQNEEGQNFAKYNFFMQQKIKQIEETNEIDEDRKQLMKKFNGFKSQNKRFQKFIKNFKNNEAEFSEKLKSMSLNLKIEKKKSKKVIDPQQALMNVASRGSHNSKQAKSEPKQKFNASCAMPNFFAQNNQVKSQKLKSSSIQRQTNNIEEEKKQDSPLQTIGRDGIHKSGEALQAIGRDGIQKSGEALHMIGKKIQSVTPKAQNFKSIKFLKSNPLSVGQKQRSLSESKQEEQKSGSDQKFNVSFVSDLKSESLKDNIEQIQPIIRNSQKPQDNNDDKEDGCSESSEEAQIQILEKFSKFIKTLSKKHEIIDQSCSSPILFQLQALQTKLEVCDQEIVDRYFSAIAEYNNIKNRVEKHRFLNKELHDNLFKATEEFLQEQKNNQSDFKKVLEAEFKYKTAYREVQDKRVKILDLEDQLKSQKMIFENISEEKDNMIKDIQKMSDEVFRQILKTMINNYSHLDTEGIMDREVIDEYLKQAARSQDHQEFQAFMSPEIMIDQQINSSSQQFQMNLQRTQRQSTLKKVEEEYLLNKLEIEQTFVEAKSVLKLVPDIISKKIEGLDAISEMISEVSESYTEYCFKVFDLTKEDSSENESNDDQEELKEAPLREKFLDRYMPYRAQKKRLQLSLVDNKTKLENYLKVYKQRSNAEISDRLRVLKLLIDDNFNEGFNTKDLFTDCKNTYINEIKKYQEQMKQGISDFGVSVKISNENFEAKLKKLQNLESKFEFLNHNENTSTKNKISLMLQNPSLLKLQFKNEAVQNEESLRSELENALKISNIDLRSYLHEVEDIQNKLFKLENRIDSNLDRLENVLICTLVKSYNQIKVSFSGLFDTIKVNRDEQNQLPFPQHKDLNITAIQRKHGLNKSIREKELSQASHLGSIQSMDLPECLSIQSFHSSDESLPEIQRRFFLEQEQIQIQRRKNEEYRSGYNSGKKEMLDCMNQAIKVFWEVWKTSAVFKAIVMRDIYDSLNKNRPRSIDEIVVLSYEHRGPSPKCQDIKHLTPLLCDDLDREHMMDVVCQILGEIEVCAETFVNLDWPRKIRIPVYIKATMKSFSAKSRFHYSSLNNEDCWVQWIGKPILKVNVEPRIGLNYDLKTLFPRVKSMLELFLENQIVAFEKEYIDVPMTYVPKYAQRYDVDKKPDTKDKGTNCCFQLSKYRKEFFKKDNMQNIGAFENHLHIMKQVQPQNNIINQ